LNIDDEAITAYDKQLKLAANSKLGTIKELYPNGLNKSDFLG